MGIKAISTTIQTTTTTMSSFVFGEFNAEERFADALHQVINEKRCSCSYLSMRDETCRKLGRSLTDAEKKRITYMLKKSEEVCSQNSKATKKTSPRKERKQAMEREIQARLATEGRRYS